MNLKNSYIVAVKDIKEVFSSISIYGPMIGVPLFFAVVLPFMSFYVAFYNAPYVAARIASLPTAPQYLRNLIGTTSFLDYFSINVLGPVFLTMPIITASVIAADSFSGEKERKTSEALLSTPIAKSDLLFGKMLASFVPTILLTLVVFAVYGSVINILSFNAFHEYVLPTTAWFMMIVTSPFLAVAAIGFVVMISAHVRGTKEAQQISTLLILPILTLPFISVLGIADLTASFFVYLTLGLFVLDVAVIYVSIKSFRKESIL